MKNIAYAVIGFLALIASAIILNIDTLLNLFVAIGCLVLTFRGYPFAMVSFLGYIIMMTSVGTVFGVWFNPSKDQRGLLFKVQTTIIGALLLFFGNWVLVKGGLASIAVASDHFDSQITIDLGITSLIVGIVGGLKGWQRSDNKV